MSKLIVRDLGSRSFSASGGGNGEYYEGAGVYFASASGEIILLFPHIGYSYLNNFSAHWSDVDVYDSTGVKITCSSVSEVVAALNSFVGNFNGSAAETDPSSLPVVPAAIALINSKDGDTPYAQWFGTQVEYDAIVTKDEHTLYYIVEE